jgi:hypothetical protein
MKIFFPVLFIISIFISFLNTGCNPSSSDSGTATLKGIVFDTSKPSQPSIKGATIYLEQTNQTTLSDSNGFFLFTNLSSGVYAVYVSKAGYNKFSTTVLVEPDTVTWMTAPLIFKNVYIYNGIVMDEYFSSSSNSAADLLNGRTVADNINQKDIQLRDTIIGGSTLLWMRSANLDLLFGGFATYFSNMFSQTYTKAQFDTLSKYNTEDGFINPYRDFPNLGGIDRFLDYQNFQHNVCAFYLAGRYTGAVPRVYGLMYIDSLWYDVGMGAIRMIIDIKINTSEKNDFSFSSTK